MSTHCRTIFLTPKGFTPTPPDVVPEIPMPVNFIVTPDPDDPTIAHATWEFEE